MESSITWKILKGLEEDFFNENFISTALSILEGFFFFFKLRKLPLLTAD